ncbi:hypothetical protein CDL15_Pgr014543 [Punica granatum]|uniref:Fungal lipase-type domain-containing protein n=1 Tax=Punica granatum TaxID=22663 RepID=A0A218WEU3_PUNGR|nr:hypothetical protein CDL15_Pgr014543 [Punica granatum]
MEINQSTERILYRLNPLLNKNNMINDSQHEPTTGATVFRDRNLIVVAFRGTRAFVAEDWRTDVDISWYELEGIGKAHRGFMEALGLQQGKGWPKEIQQGPDGLHQYAYYELRSLLKEALRADTDGEDMKFIVTGHSLGGALAILFASVLAIHEEAWLLERLEGVYAFGQPRVGDEPFGEFMKQRFKTYKVNYLRYVYSNDIVPRLPADDKSLMFKHFSPCLFFGSWLYRGKVLEEEPNKNYFSPLWAIPKVLNAVWELIRGFIIPYIEGPTYTESWVLKLVRLFGIAVPGIPAHCPQDYVNLTRLGPVTYLEDDYRLA